MKLTYVVLVLGAVDALPISFKSFNFGSFLESAFFTLPSTTADANLRPKVRPLLSQDASGTSSAILKKIPKVREPWFYPNDISKPEFVDWLNNQTEISLEGIIQNVGGYGHVSASGNQRYSKLLERQTMLPGVVVASPSQSNPDYYYHWTRDAAIAVMALVAEFEEGDGRNETLRSIIEDYVRTSYIIQRTDNPSGSFGSLDGLGEPKFRVDGSAFLGSWGRPQRDGPALRALSIMGYMRANYHHRHAQGYYDTESLASKYLEVVVPDLEYVRLNWLKEGYDLWEEVWGHHFFTTVVQTRALQEGARFARIMGDSSRAQVYEETAREMIQFTKGTFKDWAGARIIANSPHNGRSGLDSGVFIGAITLIDLSDHQKSVGDDGSGYEEAFPLHSDEMLNTLTALLDDMEGRYTINTADSKLDQPTVVDNAKLAGFGIGRYPEDLYDGYGSSLGNPWFLCTSSVAHVMYRLARYLHTQPTGFTVALTPFYERVLTGQIKSRASAKLIKKGDSDYGRLVQNLIAYGDSFLNIIRHHQGDEGDLSEQFNRDTGYMQGASKLTWSYEALWSAIRQRKLTVDGLPGGKQAAPAVARVAA